MAHIAHVITTTLSSELSSIQMGAGQSSAQALPPSHALHVLRVTPSSPASQTTIEPFFDFIVGFEGDSLSSQSSIDAAELERIVESHEGRLLNLLVWSVVPIVPSRTWSQSEVLEAQDQGMAHQPSLLGLSMRMCEPEFALDNVWHVLDVLEGSPAESAGLVPYGDYITGWSGGILSAENDFYDLVEAHVHKPLRVYVYSQDFDALREVVLVPNRHWGGEGLLGCVFGYGLLHRIPQQSIDHDPVSTPPELAEDDFEQQNLFVPADIHGEPEFSQSRLAEWRKQEQEQWHQETLEARNLYDASSTTLEHISSSPILKEEVETKDSTDYTDPQETREEESRIPGTPRRSSPSQAGVLTPTLTRGSSFGTILMNGPTKSVFTHEENVRINAAFTRKNSGTLISSTKEPEQDGSDDGSLRDERASVADTDITSRGSLTSVD